MFSFLCLLKGVIFQLKRFIDGISMTERATPNYISINNGGLGQSGKTHGIRRAREVWEGSSSLLRET